MSANAFVKKEVNAAEKMPDVEWMYMVDPCDECPKKASAKSGCRAWEACMRKPRPHPNPKLRRVHKSKVDRETDFACVLQGDDGKEEITWSYNTRCWVACDQCWNLGQCLENNHNLDIKLIPFLHRNEVIGVTPAKRSCKSNPWTPKLAEAEDREPKRARSSPGGGSPEYSPTHSPTPPRLPPRPAVVPVETSSSTGGASSSSTSLSSPSSGDDSSSPPLFGVDSENPPEAQRGSPKSTDKGKGPATPSSDVQKTGGAPSLTTETAAAAGAGGEASAGGDSGVASPMAPNRPGGDIMSELDHVVQLREQARESEEKVSNASVKLTKIESGLKLCERDLRQIESAISVAKKNKGEIEEEQKIFAKEAAAAKVALKGALMRCADMLKQEAAKKERDARAFEEEVLSMG